MSDQIWRSTYTVKLVLSVLLYTITYSITFKLANNPLSDYIYHMDVANNIFMTFNTSSVYPIWHLCVKTVYEICHICLPVTIEYITAVVTGVINVCIYWTIEGILSRRGCYGSVLISFGSMFVTALYLPWFSNQIYLGHGGPNTWHNPTALIVKPFAIVSFFLICDLCKNIRNNEALTKKDYIVLAVSVLLSVLAKPSFFQCIVPALGIYILTILIIRKGANIKGYICMVISFVPAFIPVLVAFITAFYSEEGDGVGFGWMELWKYSSPHPLFSFFTVIVFPLAYVILNLKRAVSETAIQMALLTLLSGFLEYSLLFEKGKRMHDGNFGWALDLSYFIIWIVTTMYFFKDWLMIGKNSKKTLCKNSILMVIWLLHLASGMYYVIQFLFDKDFII